MGENENESTMGFIWNTIKKAVNQDVVIIKNLYDVAKKKNVNPFKLAYAIVAMRKATAAINATDSFPHCYIEHNKSFLDNTKIVPKAICLYSCNTREKPVELYKNVFNVKYLGDSDYLSVHALVDYEKGLIYQTLPWNCKGAHQFTDLDESSIGIVVCGVNPFYGTDSDTSAYNMLVLLVAWLFKTCQITVTDSSLKLQDKNVSDITSDWKKNFLQDVQKQIDKGGSQEELKQYFVDQANMG